MISFYCHFESVTLNQILLSSFYACRDMLISTIMSIGLFISMNSILFIGYFITNFYEDADGSFEHGEPQKIMNIIFNFIFFSMNGNCLYNISLYNQNCK